MYFAIKNVFKSIRMKLCFRYLPLTALLYNSPALCSAVNFHEEDEDFQRAIQLSLEESDCQFAINLSSEINTLSINEPSEDLLEKAIQLSLTPDVTVTEESYQLEEHYFGKKPLNGGDLIPQPEAQEKELRSGDLNILDEIFKRLQTEYNTQFACLENLCAEDPVFLQDTHVNESSLAHKDAMEVQDIIDKQSKKRASRIKTMAKEQGILESQDQRERMIKEFMFIKECSRSFAEKVYEQFFGG